MLADVVQAALLKVYEEAEGELCICEDCVDDFTSAYLTYALTEGLISAEIAEFGESEGTFMDSLLAHRPRYSC